MRPNLFIIGAPKCGTSSLFSWLSDHPDIRGSRIKEPFVLTDPSHPLSRRPNLAQDGIEAYESLFLNADTNAAFRMEATTHYLFDPFARAAITHMHDARVIVVLREPAARVYSSFQYTANNLARLSPDLTFARYVALVQAGVPLSPNWCRHQGSAHVLEHDLDYSRYVKHLRPWITDIGFHRMKILLMENMTKDPIGTIREILDWLGLEYGRMNSINRAGRNRTKQVRIPKLQSLTRKINAHVRPPKKLRQILLRAYSAIQFRQSAEMKPEDIHELSRLRARYAPDNEELTQITGLDLRAWSDACQTLAN